MRTSRFHRSVALLGGGLALLLSGGLLAAPPDPFAGNNTLYPPDKDWPHGFRTSNYDYPQQAPGARWLQQPRPRGALTLQSAPAYVAAVKRFIEKDLSGLVNEPLKWTPQQAGWYDMPWGGQGNPLPNGEAIDPGSGREALLGSYTGQILQPEAYPSLPPKVAFQNHAVVYYNDVAAAQLGKIWRDPFHPDLKAAQFPEGSMVVKVEAATLNEEQWPVLKGSSVSYVFRPPVAGGSNPPTAVVTPMRFLQMAVRVKDKEAAPETGWVFIAFAYDAGSSGKTVWERAVPVGAMWGNDPEFAREKDGGQGRLRQTWVSPTIPPFIKDGLGWGGRLAGPLDLGIRHNAVTVSGVRYGKGDAGLRASSCVSCHSSAQYPFVANLYPSPNMSFPPEGQQFLLFDPGSAQWAQWFQNRPGNKALSGKNHQAIVGTDYDMMLTFALMRANGSADTDSFIRRPIAGH
ncbi:hypothetical protein [Roseateles violae]|uniref:Cytochrome c domain-containing protein n=1 Tax=Roseateles violae TaxID=3058042 RepID=A0ABT8DR05_9BURK|nr:hypothetical protein [Pelomonas sp. PFR6]MDN3918704.1 hypothetical protein [Pelomonas sp. PFR6]